MYWRLICKEPGHRADQIKYSYFRKLICEITKELRGFVEQIMLSKVFQIKVGREYVAQDMVYATAKQKHIDILVVDESNRKLISSYLSIKKKWIL